MGNGKSRRTEPVSCFVNEGVEDGDLKGVEFIFHDAATEGKEVRSGLILNLTKKGLGG